MLKLRNKIEIKRLRVRLERNKRFEGFEIKIIMVQELCVTRSKGKILKDREGGSEKGEEEEVVGREITAMEMSGMDRAGLLSELAGVLVELGCVVTAATAWTHNDRVACIILVEDALKAGPISDPKRLGLVEEQLENVVAAHRGERKRVRVTRLGAGHTHRERRLHQLMYADRDYESCRACDGDSSGEHKKGCDGTHVSVGKCEDKGYLVVNVRSRDRPKLLFDTVCVLTDMQYVVFHAAISSKRSMAHQVHNNLSISIYCNHWWVCCSNTCYIVMHRSTT